MTLAEGVLVAVAVVALAALICTGWDRVKR